MTTNATVKFLGPEPAWAKAEIQLDDVHGLWGGQMVALTGQGHITLERVAPAFRPGRWETTLSDTATLSLFRQFIDCDFVTLTLPDHTPVPDEAHPQITLTNVRGEKHSVLKWAGQHNSRFEVLYTSLQSMAEDVMRATRH